MGAKFSLIIFHRQSNYTVAGKTGTSGKVGENGQNQYYGLGKFNTSLPFLPKSYTTARYTTKQSRHTLQ